MNLFSLELEIQISWYGSIVNIWLNQWSKKTSTIIQQPSRYFAYSSVFLFAIKKRGRHADRTLKTFEGRLTGPGSSLLRLLSCCN